MTTTQQTFGPRSLEIDADREVSRISAMLNDYLARARRRGVVVGLSGGIDSSTVAAVCVAALGSDRVGRKCAVISARPEGLTDLGTGSSREARQPPLTMTSALSVGTCRVGAHFSPWTFAEVR